MSDRETKIARLLLTQEIAEFDVAPHRHPITDIVGQQTEPIVVAALVQKLGFAVEELGDFLGQQQARDLRVLFAWPITHGAPPT